MPESYSDKYASMMQQLLEDEQQKGRPGGMLLRLRARGPLTDETIAAQLQDEVRRGKDPQTLQTFLQAHGLWGDVAKSGGLGTSAALAKGAWDTAAAGAQAVQREPSLLGAAYDEAKAAGKAAFTGGLAGRMTPDVAHATPEEAAARALGSMGGHILGTMGQYGAIGAIGAGFRRSPWGAAIMGALEAAPPPAKAAAVRGLKAVPGMLKAAPGAASRYIRNNLPEVSMWAASGAGKGYAMGAEASERADRALREGRTPDPEMGEYYDSPEERAGRMAIGAIAEPFNNILPAREKITATGILPVMKQVGSSLTKHMAPQIAVNAAQEGADAAVSGRDVGSAAKWGGLFGGVLAGSLGMGGIAYDAIKGAGTAAGKAAASAAATPTSVAAKADALIASAAPGRTATTPEIAGGPPTSTGAPSVPDAPVINLGAAKRVSQRGEGLRKPLPANLPQVTVPHAQRNSAIASAQDIALLDLLERIKNGTLREADLKASSLREVPKGANLTLLGSEQPLGVALQSGPRSIMGALGPEAPSAASRFATLLPQSGDPRQMPYREYKMQYPKAFDWYGDGGETPSYRSMLDPTYSTISTPRPFTRQGESFVAIGRNASAPAEGTTFDPTSVRYNLAMPGQSEYMVDVPSSFDPELERLTEEWLQMVQPKKGGKGDRPLQGASPMVNPRDAVTRALAEALAGRVPEGDLQAALRNLMSSHASGSPF